MGAPVLLILNLSLSLELGGRLPGITEREEAKLPGSEGVSSKGVWSVFDRLGILLWRVPPTPSENVDTGTRRVSWIGEARDGLVGVVGKLWCEELLEGDHVSVATGPLHSPDPTSEIVPVDSVESR